jgi:hypothetical protein
MKVNKLTIGIIAAIFVFCILAVVAVLIQQQSPDQPGSQGPSDANATGDDGTTIQPPPLDISGQVKDKYGNALGDVTVTLHLMSYDYTNGNVSGIREADTLTATTNASGEYIFSSVPRTAGVDYCYVSATKDIPGDWPTHANGENITMKNASDVRSDLVLYMPTPG